MSTTMHGSFLSIKITGVFCSFVLLACAAGAGNSIDLSGTWQFQLGAKAAERTLAPPETPMKIPETFSDIIRLPGTTDTNHKGEKTVGSTPGTYTRRHRWVGRAWCRRTVTIPPEWKGRDVELFLERVFWKTTVFLDGPDAPTGD
jgi:hypothetical protein